MNLLIDIDGTITDDIPNEDPESMKTCLPFPGAVTRINKLREEGHTITFFTSRTDDHKEITENWLSRHGFQYDHLILNKPRGGNYLWIDNLDVFFVKYIGQPWQTLDIYPYAI